VAVIVGNEVPASAPDPDQPPTFLAGWHDGWAAGYEAGRRRREATTDEMAARPGDALPREYRRGWHEGWLAGFRQGRERRDNSFDHNETAA
jgi:hypothetical protein